MKKTAKRIAAAAMAVVAAATMAISASAANCYHLHATRKIIKFDNGYTTTHQVKYSDENEYLQTTTCSVAVSKYNTAYFCDSCGTKVGDAPSLTTERHSFYRCSLYPVVNY